MVKMVGINLSSKVTLLLLCLLLLLFGVIIFLNTRGSIFNNEQIYDKYNSFVLKAANANNPEICNQINFGQDHGDYSTTAEESRYFCKADYAIETGDIEYCRTLDIDVKYTGTISQRNKCLRGLAQKLKDAKLCEEMVDKTGAWFTEQYIKGCKDGLK